MNHRRPWSCREERQEDWVEFKVICQSESITGDGWNRALDSQGKDSRINPVCWVYHWQLKEESISKYERITYKKGNTNPMVCARRSSYSPEKGLPSDEDQHTFRSHRAIKFTAERSVLHAIWSKKLAEKKSKPASSLSISIPDLHGHEAMLATSLLKHLNA